MLIRPLLFLASLFAFLACATDGGLGLGLAKRTDDGLTKLVQWDKYSLSVKGKRLFIYSGEFHYQRLPVPELWPDIFQKFKANGLNAVRYVVNQPFCAWSVANRVVNSIYFFWSYHSPSKGLYDFKTGAKNIQKVLDDAKKAGLYVIARPGPYNLIPSSRRPPTDCVRSLL